MSFLTPSGAHASGSATGNPRNKVALGPGRSFMDWVSLCNTNKDLAGTGGKLLDVTKEELATHSQPTDAWIAIGGIVYNVTKYMSFHPGGEEELMRGVGTDATKLFLKIHSWVNYKSMLKSCVVGRLVSGGNSATSSPVWEDIVKKPINDRLSNLNSNLSTVNISQISSVCDDSPKLLSRMSWFQQLASIELHFYLKTNSKSTAPLSRVSVMLNNSKCIIARIDEELHVYSLEEEIRWPCVVKVSQMKAEIKLIKKSSKLWISLGKEITNHEEIIPEYCRMKVVHVSLVTHDTKLIGLQYERRILHHVHVGHHVKLKCIIQGEEVSRSYTPVSFLIQTPAIFPEPTLFFLIKKYAEGKLSRKLCSLESNEFIEMSRPRGTFNCAVLKEKTTLLMLAAGTGLTPMTSLTIWTLNSTRLKVRLIYFNKTEVDILWREELNRLVSANSRFQVKHVLSQPTSLWEGDTGLVNENLIKSFLSDNINDYFTCICGSSIFNNLCTSYLTKCGCSEDNYFAFSE